MSVANVRREGVGSPEPYQLTMPYPTIDLRRLT
jgi:hypothetical protein